MKTKQYSGALPVQHLFKLINEGFIIANVENVKPSSLDVVITDEVYEIGGSFQVPQKSTVLQMLKQLKHKKVSLNDPLQVGKYYLAKINETIDLPAHVYGYANPKSTTGRLDIHARMLADHMPQNDALQSGFSGELWVHIKPQSFDIKLHAGIALNQIRLFYSDTRLNKEELEFKMQKNGLLYSDELVSPINEIGLVRYKDMQVQDSPDSIVLRLDGKLGKNGEPVGYRAKQTTEVIEYDKKYAIESFFEPIEVDTKGLIYLPKDCFNILSSAERVSVPGALACEMASIDDRFGELRSHYAGFIDPGWGWSRKGDLYGRPLTLEVRPFENIYVQHGQPIARIKFERLAEMPETTYDDLQSNYVEQTKAKLAKQFVQ